MDTVRLVAKEVHDADHAATVSAGVPPIELVDGEKLIDMLEELELGLSSVRSYRLDNDSFEEFRQ